MEYTTLCYIEKDDKYLMLHRNKRSHDINSGKWIGVGGHIETFETPEACIKREVFEETGLTLKSFTLRGVLHFCGDFEEITYLYTSSDFSGEIKSCEEGELAWIDKKNIFSLPIWEGDRIFLNLLETRNCPFYLYLVYDKGQLLSYHIDEEKII